MFIGLVFRDDFFVRYSIVLIKKKKLNAIVLNSLNDKGAGFKHDTNKITFINNKSEIIKFKLKTKVEVSKDIFKEIIKLIDE